MFDANKIIPGENGFGFMCVQRRSKMIYIFQINQEFFVNDIRGKKITGRPGDYLAIDPEVHKKRWVLKGNDVPANFVQAVPFERAVERRTVMQHGDTVMQHGDVEQIHDPSD